MSNKSMARVVIICIILAAAILIGAYTASVAPVLLNVGSY